MLNVADAGDDGIALIVELIGTDGRSLLLFDYEDGVPIEKMRLLQAISAGE